MRHGSVFHRGVRHHARGELVRPFVEDSTGVLIGQSLVSQALYDEMCALRRDDAVADYATFVKVATQRHTIRARRATLLPDGLTAAARAAFETLSATRNEDSIVSLARNTMALDSDSSE
jgi:hypothetical protein